MTMSVLVASASNSVATIVVELAAVLSAAAAAAGIFARG